MQNDRRHYQNDRRGGARNYFPASSANALQQSNQSSQPCHMRGYQQYGNDSQQYRSGPQQYGSGPQQYGSGSQQYRSGPQQYGSGSQQYRSGPQQHGSGSQQYRSGSQQYRSGPQQYGSGSQQYRSGPQQHGSGSQQYRSGPRQYGSGSQQCIPASQRYRSAPQQDRPPSQRYRSGPQEFGSGSQRYRSGPQEFGSGPQQNRTGTQQFGSGSKQHRSGNNGIQENMPYNKRKEYSERRRRNIIDPSVCICQQADYDLSTKWVVAKSAGETIHISMSEPVISFLSPSKEPIPHYHISEPPYLNPAQIGRKMTSVKLPKEISSEESFDFKVLSYNVLSDELLKANERLYQGYPAWLLDWEHRKKNLMKEILTYDADIVCLQEVQENHMNEVFHPMMQEKGYIGLYKQRTGGKPDGCAVFFKQNQFDNLGCRLLELRKPGHYLMNRDNVAVIVALQPKGMSAKSTLFIANTHLLFNKNRGDIKLLQLATLLAEVDEMAKEITGPTSESMAKGSHNPVIICGDFNSAPFSPLHDFLVNGELKYKGMSSVHISGQNSPGKKPTQHSLLDKVLIPEDFDITYLCQKKDMQKVCASVDLDSSDCFIVAEKIDGKSLVLAEPGVLKHLLNLQSSYKHILKNGQQEVTTCHSEGCLCVDYIMFSQGMQRTISKNIDKDDDILIEVPMRQLYLTGVLSLLGSDEVVSMGKLPNIFLSSDHLALLACFKLFK